MWTFLFFLILIIGGIWGFNRFRNLARWKIGGENRITEDKTIDEWTALINSAANKADKTMEKLARAIQAEKIPNISISKKEVKLGGDPRPFIVIEHSFLKGYTMYVSALAYGEERLNIVWYLIFDTPEVMAARRNAKYGTSDPTAVMNNIASIGGFGRVMNMSILDKLELSNYVSLVHSVVVDTTKELMKEQNLDFSKINTQTKGFLKLS
ncbi:MAG: hypothetical protein Q8P23_01475 [bacterium]|nr:hypothetical protein [bacterium]